MNEALDFPLPPTTGSFLGEPPTSIPPPAPAVAALPPAAAAVAPPAPAPAPGVAPDELTALRDKVAELEQVVALAKTRVETLGAEKREALERALALEAQLAAAQHRETELLARLASYESPRSAEETTLAELLQRVAALEAIVAPSRAA